MNDLTNQQLSTLLDTLELQQLSITESLQDIYYNIAHQSTKQSFTDAMHNEPEVYESLHTTRELLQLVYEEQGKRILRKEVSLHEQPNRSFATI